MVNITLRVTVQNPSIPSLRVVEIEELSSLLATSNRSVTIEQVEDISFGSRAIWTETLAIFIGTAAGSGLIGAVVTDVYSIAKTWARNQFKKDTETFGSGVARTQSFTLYDQDGKPILTWKISYDGEHEQLHREI